MNINNDTMLQEYGSCILNMCLFTMQLDGATDPEERRSLIHNFNTIFFQYCVMAVIVDNHVIQLSDDLIQMVKNGEITYNNASELADKYDEPIVELTEEFIDSILSQPKITVN